MPTLHLLRHAKSSWDSPTLHDHDRPLAPRGIRACALISADLREKEIAPDLVLCSTAVRTRETLSGVEEAFGAPGPTIEFRAGIYGASGPALVSILQGIPAGVGSAMLIGHQPGIGAAALELADSGERLADIAAKFPTAALATLEFEGGWEGLGSGSARLTGFVKPKELEAGRP